MDGTITIGTELDTITIDKQIELLEDKLEGLVEEYDILERAKPFEGQQRELIKLGNEIDTTRKKIERLKNSQSSVDFSDMGKNLKDVVRHVGKWAIAVIGIRSAYNFIRSSMSTLVQENDMLNAKVTAIRSALAQSVAPIVEYLVNLAYRLVTYLGYIIKAWTGRDIFAKSSKSMASASKSAQKLSKTMAGFDEMNVLNDTSSSGGGGGGGATLPTPEDVPIPSWVQWIAKNGKLVGSVIAGITASLVALKLLGLDPLMSLGIGVLVAGVVMLVQDIVDLISDPSWENLLAVLGDIAIIIGGLMLIMGNWWGLLVTIVGLVVKLIAENWDTIMGILGAVGSWIYENIIVPVGNFFSGLWNGIVEVFKKSIEIIKSVFSGTVNFFKGIIDKVLGLFKKIGTKVGDVIGSAFKNVINSVMAGVETILNAPIKGINKLIDVINTIPGVNLKPLNTLKFPRLAKGTILNNPGRGVPVAGGSAIAGEAGREAYIPLSDTQLLQELGSTIGRYITIELTNITELDGRTIARKVNQLTQNENFLRNR